MRLAGCLLVELGLAAALLAAGAVGAVRGVGEFRAAVVARRPHAGGATGGGALTLRPRQELSVETPGQSATQSGTGDSTWTWIPAVPGTFLGMSDELLLERLRSQRVTRLKLNHGGSSLSFRVDFADGSRAAWKPAQTNAQTVPRKEVAAYRLNRLLGLNAVPPAVPRAISREDLFGLLDRDSTPALPRIRAETIIGPNGIISGEASYWIPAIKDSPLDTSAGHTVMAEWLTQGQAIPFQHRAVAAQIARVVVFDFLIANPDRYSGGNMKTTTDGSQLFFMDNTMSFFLDHDGPEKNRLVLSRTQRFSRGLHQALGSVDAPTLRRLLREPDGTEILTQAEIKAVVQRRQFIEQHVAELTRRYGEKDVLCFP